MEPWFAVWVLVVLGIALIIGVIVGIKEDADEGLSAFLGFVGGNCALLFIGVLLYSAISTLI